MVSQKVTTVLKIVSSFLTTVIMLKKLNIPPFFPRQVSPTATLDCSVFVVFADSIAAWRRPAINPYTPDQSAQRAIVLQKFSGHPVSRDGRPLPVPATLLPDV